MPHQLSEKEPLKLCPSCQTPFKGKYCFNCGEKKVDIKDYSLKKYIEQAVDVFTHFDGKFYLSVKYLLFYPGKLTNEYLSGRRVKLMKPLQLFIFINLIYFIFLKSFDLFFTRLQFIMEGTGFFSVLAQKAVLQKIEKKNMPLEDYMIYFNEHAPSYGKAFVILLIPVIGLLIYICFFNKEKLYVPHLAFSTHFFTFCLLAFGIYELLIVESIIRFGGEIFSNYGSIIWGVFNIIALVYLFVALKNVYKEKPLINILKTLVIVAGLLYIITFNKILVTFITILLT